MSHPMEGIEKVCDVSYLLTMLRLAKKKGDHHLMSSLRERLRQMGMLPDGSNGSDPEYINLRRQVDKIIDHYLDDICHSK